MPTFAKAYQCKMGDPMVRPEEKQLSDLVRSPERFVNQISYWANIGDNRVVAAFGAGGMGEFFLSQDNF